MTKENEATEKEDIHHLLLPPDTLKIGREITLQDTLKQYLLPEQKRNKRKHSTKRDVQRHVHDFDEWWESVKAGRPLPIALIDRRHLSFFRDWLVEKGKSACNANRHVSSVTQVLKCAKRHGLILAYPELEPLEYRPVAPKLYLLDEQIDQLWEAAAKLTWPRFDSSKRRLPYSPTEAWRTALVLYRIYGFRTQELIRHERKYRPLLWGNIKEQELTPNTAGHCRCQYGWFKYVPQKQERFKADPLIDPLTWYTRAALWVVRPERPDPNAPVLDWILSSTSFRATWNKWMELAGVRPREGSGVDHIIPKFLRKTATTRANDFQPGMGEHIVGHASDRTGQQGSIISSKHYDNPEQGVLYTLLNMPYPSCFDELKWAPALDPLKYGLPDPDPWELDDQEVKHGMAV